MRQITKQQREEEREKKKRIIYIWKKRTFYKNSDQAEMACNQASEAGWF